MTVSNPSIASTGTKTFSSSSNSTLTLYGVQTENIQKVSGLIEVPLPVNDSDSKIVMDLLGASRSVNVSGVVSTDDVEDLYKYVDDLVGLNGLVTGNQKASGSNPNAYVYTSEVLNYGRGSNTTFSVYVMDVSVNRVKGDPNSFSYSINLMEADGSV